MTEGHFVYNGQLKGHGGWVTSIACPMDNSDMLLSGSRDNSIIQWQVGRESARIGEDYGFAKKRLSGHSNFVEDVKISTDGMYGLSGSWDGTLRLWNLKTGQSHIKFSGHTKDVMSVDFSCDHTRIVSGSRDNSVKIWNTKGECKREHNDHTDWVSCVKMSMNPQYQILATGSWDKTVNIYGNDFCDRQMTLKGHSGYVSSVALSPDGSLCASGGKDGVVKLWDLNTGDELFPLDNQNPIHSLTFSPNRYWVCAATGSSVKIWDLESKCPVAELVPEMPPRGKRAMDPECTSLCWSADGSILYSGYTDSTIRVWGVQA